ncbi:MAG: YceD family protein [Alkaliphilus sp.]
MNINLSKIMAVNNNQVDLEYQIDVEPINYYGDKIIISEPASLCGKLYYMDGKTFMDCIISAELQVNCSRCLKSFNYNLSTKLSVELIEKLDESCIEDGDDIIFYEDDNIDLNKIVKEQIIMSIPMKLLCHENCKGICVQCGANKNEKQCQCKLDNDEDEEKVDFRLSKLKELFHKD